VNAPDSTDPALVEALRLLAAPPPVQESSLPSWVAVPDEVALTFFDTYDVISKASIPDDARAMLEKLSVRVNVRDQLSEADRWHPETLYRSEDWEEVRALASKALTALKFPYSHPHVSGDYVREVVSRDRRETSGGDRQRNDP
jgi:hypothetical protein